MAKRFLIIQTAFLGDVILCTPVLSELRRIYPDALIDVVVRKSAVSLLENHEAVHRVIPFDKSTSKIKAIQQTTREIRKTHYDEVINLQRYFSSGLLTLFAKGKAKIGFQKNPLSLFYQEKLPHEMEQGIHEVQRNLQCIKHHGAKESVRPSLYPSEEDYEKVVSYKDQPYYCIAPASVWFTKQLPEEKWIELLKQLNHRVYFIGGAADDDLAKRIIEAAGSKNSLRLCGKLSLLQSAALLKDAEMNFVNDSGPLHLASAVNAPVTAFFCSTIPDFGFGPLSENSRIVETKENLDCRPCGVHGHKSCPKGHFNCGHTIAVEEALAKD